MVEGKEAEVIDYETTGRPSLTIISSGLELLAGDHIHWRRNGAWRDGILITMPQSYMHSDTFYVSCIRYGYIFPQMQIKKEIWHLNFKEDVLKRYEYGQFCHPPHIVISRAKACLTQKGYNALRNNNEDFCRWCKCGKHTYMVKNDFQMAGILDKDESESTEWVSITGWDQAAYGDHVAWKGFGVDIVWQYGILISTDDDEANIVTSDGAKCFLMTFTEESVTDINRVLYRSCHPSHTVLRRAQQYLDSLLSNEETYVFAKWCKTGVPANSKMTEILIETFSEQGQVLGKEAAGTAGRASATSAARGVITVATSAARGAIEGAAAVAAVGAEAVIIGVEVGLTYKNFSKQEISKDELNKRNIITVSKCTGAAGGAIAGGAAGAAIGSIVPVVGTTIGGIIGGIVGGVLGQISGHFSGRGIAHAARRPYDTIFVGKGLVLCSSN